MIYKWIWFALCWYSWVLCCMDADGSLNYVVWFATVASGDGTTKYGEHNRGRPQLGTSSDWFLQFFLLKFFHSKTTLHLAGTNPPCNHSGVSCARYILASNWESTAYYGNLRNFIYVYVFNSFVLIYMYVFNPPPITSPKQTFKLHIACVCISFTTNRNTEASEAHKEFYTCEFVYFLYLEPTQSRHSFIFSICGCM